MFKKIFLLTVVSTAAMGLSASAQSRLPTFEQLETGDYVVQNPFKSQLPPVQEIPEAKTATADRPEARQLPEPDNQPKKTESQPHIPQYLLPAKEIEDFSKEMPQPSFIVTGIIWNSQRPQAIINGQIVDIGDTVVEAKITNIQKSRIDAMFYGRAIVIKP